jgi:hypothetical protein
MRGTIANGYVRVTVWKDGQQDQKLLHRLICEAFHGKPADMSMHACHGDGNSLNNCAYNIRWDTAYGNRQDTVRHGRANRGERHGLSKLTISDVEEIMTLIETGRSDSEIAEMFSLCRTNIRSIRVGRTWTYKPKEKAL